MKSVGVMRKHIETLAAVTAIAFVSLLFVLAAQTEGAQQLKTQISGLFFEDLDDVAAGPTQPEALDGGIAEWIVSDDYPAEALRKEWQGTSTIAWTVDRRGRIVNCHIVRSSEHHVLDDAACKAITSRGRFTPARNENGRRIEYEMQRRIVWRLPD